MDRPTQSSCREPADSEVLGIHARYLQLRTWQKAKYSPDRPAQYQAAHIITRARDGSIDDHVLTFSGRIPDTLESELLQTVGRLQLRIEHVVVIHFTHREAADRSSRQLHDDLYRFGPDSLWRWIQEFVNDSPAR